MLKGPSQITKVVTMSDGGLRLHVDTQKLDIHGKAEVMGLHNKTGWFVFSDVGIQESDVPSEPIEFTDRKTLSERLRDVLWVLHHKQGGKEEEFEAWRSKIMESLIKKYKQKSEEAK